MTALVSISTDNAERLGRAVETVAGLSPTGRQRRLLTWLAEWDRETATEIAKLIEEAYSAGFCDGARIGEPDAPDGLGLGEREPWFCSYDYDPEAEGPG